MDCRILKIADIKSWQSQSSWLANRTIPDNKIEKSVAEILLNVRENGDKALLEYTRQYDSKNFSPPFLVSREEINASLSEVSEKYMKDIAAAISNIRFFHEAQIEKSWFIPQKDGSILGQMVSPVDSAGLYVPGGKGGETPLVSSLLMNAIPALVAGCPRIVVVTPPGDSGKINPYILAAADMLGITEIYKLGSAWAIAALAYGTATIQKVDIITGPGNIYVAIAKKLVHGQTGIDMIAGPSEVFIIADSSANPAWVAADMLSQAEHDPLASAICITDNNDLAYKIEAELKEQLSNLPRKEIVRKSLEEWGCIGVVPDINVGIAIANLVAPEHLELCIKDPWSKLPFIKNAGAIFMGQNSPEPVGDYFAGPNHILPTLSTAKFSSSLSVQTFCKKTNIIYTSDEFIKESQNIIAHMARLEGLEAHARSVEIRTPTRQG